MSSPVFLKLGGSLITEKDTPMTPRPEVINRLAQEIAAARQADSKLQLVLGHGSGSFGHIPAKEYGTHQGVSTPAEWQGFHQVWLQARRLNNLVIDALHKAGVPAVSFPISAGGRTSRRKVISWELSPLRAALENGLLPVVYGDVVFDDQLGGTILSTEDIFRYLAPKLSPKRILLAGLEPGVWADYPQRRKLVETITTGSLESLLPALNGAAETDVTGGMRGKVMEMLDLVEESPGVEILIFSGNPDGNIKTALLGKHLGTKIN